MLNHAEFYRVIVMYQHLILMAFRKFSFPCHLQRRRQLPVELIL